MCLRLWHCEDVVRVFLMLCSATAGWYHQVLEKSGVGGTGFTGGVEGLHSCKSVKPGIELVSLLMVWMAEVARGAIGKLSSNFWSLFVCQVGGAASQSGSCSAKTHQIIAMQGLGLTLSRLAGDVHEVR